MDANLDRVVKTSKYDTCGIKRKRFVLFPATDLSAGEIFRAEASECKNLREAQVVGGGGAQSQVLIVLCIRWHPAVLWLFSQHSLNPQDGFPFYCLVNCFPKAARPCSLRELLNFIYFMWPEEDPIGRPYTFNS